MDISNLPLPQIFSAVTDFLQGPYGPIVLWIGFIIALLNCFFGYTLRKVWCTLIGVLIGCAIGAGGSIYFQQSLQITLIAGAIGAFFGGVTAFALYRVGLFVLCAGLTFFGFYFFFPTDSRQALLFYLIAGVIVGILSNLYEHIVIILATSICGGLGALQLYYLINGGNPSLVWICGILISILGFVFQLKPWKDRGYWRERRSRDRAAQDEYRSRRRQRKSGRPSLLDRFSSLFGRKKKTKKKVRTVYETSNVRPDHADPYGMYGDDASYDYDRYGNPANDGYEEPSDYEAYDGYDDTGDYDDYTDPQDYDDPSAPQTDGDSDDSSPEFDYAKLDPLDYAMEDQYSVHVDRSVFDKTQPDLAVPPDPDATKTFSLGQKAPADTRPVPPKASLRESAAAAEPGGADGHPQEKDH